MPQIIAIEIGGRKHLAEVAGLPGKTVIVYGNFPATVLGADCQAATGIEATVAVGCGKQMSEAFLIGLKGGLIAQLKLLPRQNRCLAVEGDALLLLSRLSSFGRDELGPRCRRFIHDDRP